MSRGRPRTRLPRSVPVGQMRRNLRAVQRFRLNVVFLAVLALYLVLLGRLGKLQVVDASTWKSEARESQHGRAIFRGLRGRILDARGRTLVTSRRVLSLAVDMQALHEHADTPETAVADFCRRLAVLLDEGDGGRRLHAILRAANPASRHVPLCGPIEDERIIGALIGYSGEFQRTVQAGLGGLKVEVGECRTYPNGDYALHVLGLPPDGSCGRRGHGIEQQCQAELLGGSVSVPYLRGYRGRPMVPSALDPLEARGRDVRITLDIVVQHYAEVALDAAMATWQATDGAAIVVEPSTGHVLALVSRPRSGLNWAISALWAPGSLLKPLTVAKGLDGGYTTPQEVFDLASPRNFRWSGSRQTRDVRDMHAIAPGTVFDILVHSSNVGVAQIFWRLLHGPDWASGQAEPSYDRAVRYLEELGFYGPSGIELPGEGVFPLTSDEHPNVLYPALGWSFGKGVGTTPLKVLCAFAALARDDARVLRPTLLPGQGGPRMDLPPVCRSADDLRVVREALRAVTREGTAQRAFAGSSLDVAAKTGTAVIEGSPWQISGLIAFAPVERPRLAVLVMGRVNENTRHPDHGDQQPTGGAFAGPAARAILEKSLAYLDGRALAGRAEGEGAR